MPIGTDDNVTRNLGQVSIDGGTLAGRRRSPVSPGRIGHPTCSPSASARSSQWFENIITSIRFGPLRNVSRPRKVSPLAKSVINRLPNHHVLTLDRTLLRDLHSFFESSQNSLAFSCPFRIVTSASPREVSHACASDPERGVASRAGAREDKPVFDAWPPHSAPVLPPNPKQ